MRKSIVVAVFAAALCAAQSFATPKLPFKRGTNCRGLDVSAYSTSTWGRTYIYGLDNTYTDIKAKGFDFVRFSVDLTKYYDSNNDCLYTSGSYNIETVDWIMQKFMNAGIHVCLLMGRFQGGDINPSDSGNRERFRRVWQLTAARYKDWSSMLSFELLNEPRMSDDESVAALNAVFKEAVAAIRQTNPTRLILWPLPNASTPGSISKSGWVDLPEDRSNIAIVAHCYAPLSFTHQSSHVDLDDAARLELRWDFGSLRNFVEAHPDIPVVLNEFGVMQGSSTPYDVYEWVSSVREFCEASGIPWAHFEYTDLFNFNMGFATRGDPTDPNSWRTNVVDALFPKGWDDQPSTYGQLDFSKFSKKLQVSFTGYAGTETLADFPVLVKLSTSISGFKYSDFKKSNGGDLRFADSTGRHIPHEIDTWNPNGVSTVWVRVPSLTAATRIYACYGCDNPPATTDMDVWNDDYVGVWHLNESGLPMNESSHRSVRFTLRNGKGISFAAPGVVGGSVAFDGGMSNSLIAVDHDSLDKFSKYTFEVWTKQSEHKANAGILCKSRDYDVWRAYLLTDTGSATRLSLSRYGNDISAATDLFDAPVDGSWRHQVCSLDTTTKSDNVKGYLNGALAGTQSVKTNKFYTGAGYLVLGNTQPIGRKTSFNGSIDEVRISKCIRSADWIKATHDTVAKADFATYSFGDDTPPEPPQPTYTFAKEVNVSFTGYSGTALTDFPVLVRLSENIPGFSYGDFTLANGGDLRFFDASGNLLAHEIDTWNPSGVSTAWVKVPTLNASTKITAKYGCSGTLPFVNPKDVWDANYLGVWHLGAASGVSAQGDSTGRGHDFAVNANNSDGVASGANGVVGRSAATGVRSDGKGCFFQSDSADKLFSGHSAFTVEAWTWQDDHDPAQITTNRYVLAHSGQNETSYDWRLYETPEGKMAFQMYQVGGSAEIASNDDAVRPARNAWNHTAVAWDGSAGQVAAYLGGTPLALSASAQSANWHGTMQNTKTGFNLGNHRYDNANSFKGSIDEVRISKVARSAAWIKATHATIADVNFATYSTDAGTLSGYAAWMNVKELVGKPGATTAKGIPNAVRYAFDIDPAKGVEEIGTPIMQVVRDADGNPAVQTRDLAEGRSDVTFGILATPDLGDWKSATLIPMEKSATDGLWKPSASKKSGYDYPAQMFFKYTVEVK